MELGKRHLASTSDVHSIAPDGAHEDKMRTRALFTWVAVLAVCGAVIGHETVALAARNSNPGVIPPHANPHGKSYGEWGATWWTWAWAQRLDVHPILDETGESCAVGQSGPVWFLAGTFGGDVERHCTVPTGVKLFFPIVNISPFVGINLADGSDQRQQFLELVAALELVEGDPDTLTNAELARVVAQWFIDLAENLSVRVNGVELQDLERYRAAFSPFNFTLSDVGEFTGDQPGEVVDAASDGYWIMLSPLPPGVHTIEFSAEIPPLEFSLHVLYHLTVAPGTSRK